MSDSKLGVKAQCQKLVARAMKRWPAKENYIFTEYTFTHMQGDFTDRLRIYIGLYKGTECTLTKWLSGSYEELLEQIELLDVGEES